MKIMSHRLAVIVTTVLSLLFTHSAFADTSGSTVGVSNVESFIASITKVIVVVTGAVAITMFAIGGFNYVTSSGRPEHLQRAKHTLFYAAIGLAISIGSAVLCGIVTSLANNAFGN